MAKRTQHKPEQLSRTRKLELEELGRSFAMLTMIRNLYVELGKRRPDPAAFIDGERRDLDLRMKQSLPSLSMTDEEALHMQNCGLQAISFVFSKIKVKN